ncbi:MAG TPA: hypothetical protein VIJ07_08760 [Dermatophilaceae bacterium]
MAKKARKADDFRGQLMLQISAGRFFRPEVDINEHTHRRTIYSNGWWLDPVPVDLRVGKMTVSTEIADVSTATLEAVDRLEAKSWNGTDEFLIATGGDELIDDLAYVMSFILNRTFSRDHDQVHRLVGPVGRSGRRHGAASLFPRLFDPSQVIQPGEWDDLKQFMDELLALNREDFARVMRVIRSTVDATRRAIDDPTGAYTDLIAALESLGDDELTSPTTWDRYDPTKRKIIDAALKGESEELVKKIHTGILEADRAGLKRRFISSTIARISPDYYRREAAGAVRAPQSADIERMLAIAYDVRSRRSHVLEDLGEEAWVFTDGAETAFEPNFQRIFTLAGLWRLVRHVVRRFVADARKIEAEPWDYRGALPGIIKAQLAPQYWIWQPEGLDAKSALQRFNGVAEAFIGWHAGHHDDGFNLTQVVEKIEQLVPHMPNGEPKTAMVAIHLLWQEWIDPKDHRSEAKAFLDEHRACLDTPSHTAFTVGLLSNHQTPAWTPDEWVEMAAARHAARRKGKESPLPAAVDTLIQLEAADQLEAVGRHDEAVALAANAVEESPGNEALLQWEERLLTGNHDPNFSCHEFLFGRGGGPEQAQTSGADRRDGATAVEES